MENGTYQKTEAGFTKVSADFGYWVAKEEVTLEEVAVSEYLGVWTDPETGKTWYDKSMFVSDLVTALALAKTYNQIAIWDNANQVAINV